MLNFHLELITVKGKYVGHQQDEHKQKAALKKKKEKSKKEL